MRVMSSVRRRRDERGAVAVLAGIMCLFLFAVAALAVDLGNAFVVRRDVQSQVDFAALAGGADLPGAKSASDSTVVEAANYLNTNTPNATAPTVTPGQLVDGTEGNGEIYFTGDSKIRLIAPFENVRFGLAGALGATDVDVNAEATVGIFSAGSVMPMYAVSGCDQGPQTFTDPAGGQNVPVPRPPMMYETEPPAFNNATLTALTTSPTSVAKNDVGATLTLDGNQFNAANAGTFRVGFFRDITGTTPHLVEVVPTTRTNSVVTAGIPTSVTAVEDVWWVRIFKDGSWSPPEEARPLRVGQAVLECESGASDGNFGTLYFPRDDVTSQDDMIAKNIATSLQFDVSYMPATGPAPQCTGAPPPAVHAPNDGTNCVDTKTGMPANAATQGLITGIDGEPGRLMVDTSDRCQNLSYGARPQRAPSGISGYSINDDTLTCFLTDSVTDIGDLSQLGASYTSGVVLHEDIYSSPRFFWVPVLHIDPVFGGSDKYSIKEFRPAFLTDQPVTANATNHSMGTTTSNGIYVEQPSGNRVSRIKVVFFNSEALPKSASGAPLVTWFGGPKILALVD